MTPRTTLPESGFVTRLAGVRAVIQPVPTGVGPNVWLWAGELRHDDDRPWTDTLRVAPYTEEGKAQLLKVLTGLTSGSALRAPGRRRVS